MKKLLLTLTALTLFASPAFAANIVNIGVNGMVCDFCAQSVLKVFEENEGVENIDVNLDDALVILTMKDGATITDEEIEKNIHYAGYDLVDINRVETQAE